MVHERQGPHRVGHRLGVKVVQDAEAVLDACRQPVLGRRVRQRRVRQQGDGQGLCAPSLNALRNQTLGRLCATRVDTDAGGGWVPAAGSAEGWSTTHLWWAEMLGVGRYTSKRASRETSSADQQAVRRRTGDMQPTWALNSAMRTSICSSAAFRNASPGWWRRMAQAHSVLDSACWLKSCSQQAGRLGPPRLHNTRGQHSEWSGCLPA